MIKKTGRIASSVYTMVSFKQSFWRSKTTWNGMISSNLGPDDGPKKTYRIKPWWTCHNLIKSVDLPNSSQDDFCKEQAPSPSSCVAICSRNQIRQFLNWEMAQHTYSKQKRSTRLPRNWGKGVRWGAWKQWFSDAWNLRASRTCKAGLKRCF